MTPERNIHRFKQSRTLYSCARLVSGCHYDNYSSLPILTTLLLLGRKQLLPMLSLKAIHERSKSRPACNPTFHATFQHEDLHVVVFSDFADVLEEPGCTAWTAALGGAY